ncbi:MAG: CDP-diacylglycerol--glycerol-3-phosphate 3-phosphatidyltransferase [Bdellovibrionota bacterium]
MQWKKHLPNLLTYSRMAFVPFIIWFIYLDTTQSGIIACGLFILASITDYYDGYFARKWGIVSNMGKFMDPVADKVLVSSTLIMLIPTDRLTTIMVIILVARDSIIDGLRSVAATQNVIISAAKMGKWKTATQMVAIPCILFNYPLFGLPIYQIGYWTLWVSVALSVISGYHYIKGYLKS